MHKWRLIGGYSGELGSVTAERIIEVPSAPSRGIGVNLDGQYLTIFDGDDMPIVWDAGKHRWDFAVNDVGDYFFRECKTNEEIVQWYEEHGWEVVDIDRGKESA